MGLLKDFFSKQEEDGSPDQQPIPPPSTVGKGTKVSFFQGRRPLTGTVIDVREDGMLEISTSQGVVVKDADEVMAAQSLKGKRARIRFSR